MNLNMKIQFSLLLLLSTVVCPALSLAEEPAPGQRKVTINYEFQITGLVAGQKLQVWCPVPSSSDHQAVDLNAGEDWQMKTEAKYGNRLAYSESIASDSAHEFKLQYTASRTEFVGSSATPKFTPSQSELDRSLIGNKLVPLSGEHIKLLDGLPKTGDTMSEARQLYKLVLNHVDYRKDQPGWGRGDAVWVCDSRFGNCTDFHSLFIALARARQIPAKFEIGFSIPSQTTSGSLTGYHCWAWFYDEQSGWIPVDISEADKHPELAEYYFSNLTADRVALSTGRDIVLQPPQKGPPLNYFISPYAEVDGVPVAASQIKLKHSWQETTK